MNGAYDEVVGNRHLAAGGDSMRQETGYHPPGSQHK